MVPFSVPMTLKRVVLSVTFAWRLRCLHTPSPYLLHGEVSSMSFMATICLMIGIWTSLEIHERYQIGSRQSMFELQGKVTSGAVMGLFVTFPLPGAAHHAIKFETLHLW